MSSFILKSAWKYKMELVNIFDEKFLNDKDKALEPISFILEKENNLLYGEVNNQNNNNSVRKNKKEEKERKSKKKKKKDSKRKSLRKYEIYSSNIVLVQTMTEDGSQSSFNDEIDKEIENIKKMNKRSKTKNKKRNSKSKGLKNYNSANY